MPNPGVTEPVAGTKTTVPEPNPSEQKVETPKAGEVSPKLYTQKELDALVHAAKSETGRNVKAIETENISLKKQIQAKTDELTENTAEIDKLQVKLEGLTKDDPSKFEVIRELKTARDERKQLKADRAVLETEKASHGETVKFAQDTMREIGIWEVAAEYENGDPVKLKDLSDTFEAKSDEQIRKVADTLWTKKSVTPAAKTSTPIPYSGVTSGGSEDLNGLSSDELFQKAYSKKK